MHIKFLVNTKSTMYYSYDRYTVRDMIFIELRRFDFWIQSLYAISAIPGWSEFCESYYRHILEQRSDDGLWHMTVAFKDWFQISSSWRKKVNQKIDHSVGILRLLNRAP